MATLVESIRQYGVIQPIVVCKMDDKYQIVAGERRWRAAQLAELTTIPVVIKDYSMEQITGNSFSRKFTAPRFGSRRRGLCL